MHSQNTIDINNISIMFNSMVVYGKISSKIKIQTLVYAQTAKPKHLYVQFDNPLFKY
jgi:hypothetical protein